MSEEQRKFDKDVEAVSSSIEARVEAIESMSTERSANSGIAIIGIILLGIVLLAAMVVLPPIFRNVLAPPAPVPIDQTITQPIRELSQLVVLRQPHVKTNIDVQTDRWNAVCEIYTNNIVKGEIQAGVDLEEVNEDSFRFNEEIGRYVLTLPQPAITGCVVDPAQTIQVTATGWTPVCNRSLDEMKTIAIHLAMTEFIELSKEDRLLEKAEELARSSVTNLLTDLGRNDVEIRFSSNETAPLLPRSCDIPVPQGWQQVGDVWAKP